MSVTRWTKFNASDFTDGSFFKITDTNGVKSFTEVNLSEMKTLLGLPSNKFIAYVLAMGTAGDTFFNVVEHLDTIGMTLSFAKDGTTAGVYNFTALSSLALGKAYCIAQMNNASDYSKKYSIELYSVGTNDAYQLRIYKNGTLADIDNGDSIRFTIIMEDY